MPQLGLGLGIQKGPFVKSIIQELIDAGAVLALLSSKADGSLPLTGNDSPWVDLANNIGKNLFSKIAASLDFAVLTSSGLLISLSDWYASDYIAVEDNKDYISATLTTGGSVGTAFYDKDKVFISGIPNVTIISNGGIFTTPNNTKFIRISSNEIEYSINIFMIELGTVSTSYEPYTRNDCALFNQAGNAASGWQPTPPVNRMDGTDDYGSFADTPSLDIINAPLTIGVTFKVTNDNQGYIINKNLSNISNVQYAILNNVGRDVRFIKNGSAYANFVADSANYVNVVFYWDGVNITSYENGVQKSQTALGGTLTSAGVLRVGKGASGFFLDADIATQTIYTGSDINKILKVEAKISAQYLALNP